MKYLLAVGLVAVSGCVTDNPRHIGEKKIPELRTEYKEWESKPGEIRSTDTVYRGNERILRTFKFRNETTKSSGVWQFFYIDGKAVIILEDNGDGKSPTVTLVKNGRTYDRFLREADGSHKPVSSEELAKIQREEW